MSTANTASNMSSALFGSARRSVLALLFGNPAESYYLREIARLTGLGLGAVQRELNRLSAVGILSRTVRGRQVYFRANLQNPLFPELRGLVTKTLGLGEVLQSALKPLTAEIRLAFIFGSFARSEQSPDSDVDVLIVGDVAFESVVLAFAEAQHILCREINPAVYSVSDFCAKLKARHHFLTSVMRGPRIFLTGDDRELERLGP